MVDRAALVVTVQQVYRLHGDHMGCTVLSAAAQRYPAAAVERLSA